MQDLIDNIIKQNNLTEEVTSIYDGDFITLEFKDRKAILCPWFLGKSEFYRVTFSGLQKSNQNEIVIRVGSEGIPGIVVDVLKQMLLDWQAEQSVGDSPDQN